MKTIPAAVRQVKTPVLPPPPDEQDREQYEQELRQADWEAAWRKSQAEQEEFDRWRPRLCIRQSDGSIE